MSGGGGKGGETQQRIDPRLADASAKVLERAEAASKIPYSPNRGVTIAAFTPQQKAAMANASDAAEAFGMEGGAAPNMPKTETSATGIRGYSTGKEYDDMVAKSLSPELQAAINSFFSVKGAPAAETPEAPAKKGFTLEKVLHDFAVGK
jgi:hypothetical protein